MRLYSRSPCPSDRTIIPSHPPNLSRTETGPSMSTVSEIKAKDNQHGRSQSNHDCKLVFALMITTRSLRG